MKGYGYIDFENVERAKELIEAHGPGKDALVVDGRPVRRVIRLFSCLSVPPFR